jgi:hypothetical protein
MDADPPLPPKAKPAVAAYEAMESSKKAHFDYLDELDARVQRGGQRTLADEARLRTLLSEHDRAVADFRAENLALQQVDRAAHAAFLRYLTTRNADLGGSTETH